MTTIIPLPRFDDYDNYQDDDIHDHVKLNKLLPFMRLHRGFIAGGVFKNIVQGEEFRDVDIFFESKEDWEAAVQSHYRSNEFEHKYESERAIGFKHKETGVVVELINVFFGTPKQILNTFDFTIAKAAIVRHDESFRFLYHHEFFKHLLLRRLVIGTTMYNPINTFERTLKYTRYGYNMCNQSKVNLLSAIQKEEFIDFDNLSRSIYHGGLD